MSDDEKRVQIGAAWERLRECRRTTACWETKVSGMLERIPRTLDMRSIGVDKHWRLTENGRALSGWPTREELEEATVQLTIARQALSEAEALWERHQ